VGALSIVVDPPCFNDLAGLRQAAEQVLVKTFVSESAIECERGSAIDPVDQWPERKMNPFCCGVPGAM